MKQFLTKKLALVAIPATTFTLAYQSADAAFYKEYPAFKSNNKPFNARMASYEEMVAYRKDLNTYLKNIDREIAKLESKREEAIATYNGVASEFNSDDFFHKERIGLYKERKIKRGQRIVIISEEDDDDDFFGRDYYGTSKSENDWEKMFLEKLLEEFDSKRKF